MQASMRWAVKALKSQARLRNQLAGRSLCDQAGQKSGILAEYLRMLDSDRLHADSTQLAAVQALQLLQDSMIIRLVNQLNHTAQAVVTSGSATSNQTAATLQERCNLNKVTNKSTTLGATAAGERSGSGTAMSGTIPHYATGPAETDSCNISRPVVQGAYLWGPVGSGKTLLMDMFLRTLPAVPAPSSLPSGQCSSSNGSSTGSKQHPHGAQELQLRAHRVHYHEFMLAVHEQLHQLQQSLPRIVTLSRSGLPVYRYASPPEDPILVVARTAASGLELLCLDELHVTDVADAMLLSRLFGEILRCGCSIIFTSNRPARDLYKGGLSRKYFEPFIKLIDDRLLQLKVAGGRDYRVLQQKQKQPGPGADPVFDIRSSTVGLWYTGPDAEQRLQRQWIKLAQQLTTCEAAGAAAGLETNSSTGWTGHPGHIPLPFGRKLWLPQALFRDSGTAATTAATATLAKKDESSSSEQLQQRQALAAALFTFDQLCSNEGSRPSLEHAGALSANDFLALVRSCPVIFIQGLPQLSFKLRDEARRLVTLIDLVYEVHTVNPGGVKLVVCGQVPPHELFLPLLGAAAAQGVNPNLGKSGSRLDVKQLVQEYGGHSDAQPAVVDTFGAAVSESGGPQQRSPQNQHNGSVVTGFISRTPDQKYQGPLSALLPEEVLMYHRASSRLVELCIVIDTALRS